MGKLPLLQRVFNSYIWAVTPLLSTKAQVLTPSDWANQAANDLDSNPKSAVTIPAVLRAIQLLSETIAALPLNIYKKESDGGRTEYTNHKLSFLLNREPNKHMTSFTWRKLSINHQLTIGAFDTEIVRNTNGDVISLRALNPALITPKYDKDNDQYLFEYRNNITEIDPDRIINEEDIIHVPWYTTNGIDKKAPIELAAEALNISLNQQSNQNSLAANDSKPPGLLINEGATDEQAKQAKGAWQDANSGKNKGGTAVLSGGWDYKSIALPNDQLQFMQQREFSVTEISRIFGVPPHLLSDLSRATFSNIEHQGIEFVTYTLMGILRNIETELERKLFTDPEKRRLSIRFNVNALLRSDAKTRGELYASGIQNGWLMPNEARALEERNAIEGGSRAFIQMSLQPLDKVGEETVENEPLEDDTV